MESWPLAGEPCVIMVWQIIDGSWPFAGLRPACLCDGVASLSDCIKLPGVVIPAHHHHVGVPTCRMLWPWVIVAIMEYHPQPSAPARRTSCGPCPKNATAAPEAWAPPRAGLPWSPSP
ncbi:hypothetical protein PAPYR_13440 [Paratrimastix pyriformis]|uniref:Uncharacterized protein n=1 Tax=Paratrimastix pyriformis TaxID=342808 RepID=A0ABQ8U2F5_9EUKA|nr:hypothetical protein PAPYR_13440 [Paratrimastix pyriformis]